jgi:hypothetical protein
MIAYFAQPNRFHPFLLKLIKDKYKNFDAVFNHFNFEGKQYACHLSNHQIENVTLDRILRVKTADFFSGVLHPKYNSFLQPDFSFTIISEPVNRVYQLFYIFKFLEKEYREEGIVKKIFNTDCINMRHFIDSLLVNNYYRDIIMEHIFLFPEETETELDFVGVAEESDKTGQLLEKYINIDLTRFNFNERIDKCAYRIDDIRVSLAEQIDRYKRLSSRLKTL